MKYNDKMETLDQLAIDQEQAIIRMHDYAGALIGHTTEEDVNRAVYDYDKCISILMKRDGMSYEDAVEWFSNNTVRSLPYMGIAKPLIIQRFI